LVPGKHGASESAPEAALPFKKNRYMVNHIDPTKACSLISSRSGDLGPKSLSLACSSILC
jgi:hypothetical protein